jgi:hypothetical protein
LASGNEAAGAPVALNSGVNGISFNILSRYEVQSSIIILISPKGNGGLASVGVNRTSYFSKNLERSLAAR